MVGLYQEQAENDSLAEEKRRRRRDAERNELPHRQRSRPANSLSGMKTMKA